MKPVELIMAGPSLPSSSSADVNELERLKIAFVGDYPPRNCGIATFTRDLRDSVAAQHPEAECSVLAVNDVPEGYDYAPVVRFQLQEQRLRAYREAADFLRFNGFEVLCVQHEFGIYGGRSGAHILALLEEVGLPIGLPPWKWSSLRYGFAPGGGRGNGKEAAHGRGDRGQAAAG